VSGAVADPGAVEFSSSEGISVLQAITAAGGPTPRARLGKVTVIRLRPDGSEERFLVNLKAIRKGNAESVRLENNDTIVVEEFGF
jgi:protein involved in polysaccharide export with SLBB domain